MHAQVRVVEGGEHPPVSDRVRRRRHQPVQNEQQALVRRDDDRPLFGLKLWVARVDFEVGALEPPRKPHASAVGCADKLRMGQRFDQRRARFGSQGSQPVATAAESTSASSAAFRIMRRTAALS